MNPPSVLFIVKQRHNGYDSSYTYGSVGLSNSANFIVNVLRKYGHRSKVVSVIDSNGIDKVVTEFNADIVVVEALYAPPYKWRDLLSTVRHQHRDWYVRIHSKFSFLANEGMAVDWINRYVDIQQEFSNFYICPNVEEDADVYASLYPQGRFLFLPNIYAPSKAQLSPLPPKDRGDVHIGMFGAVRPFKNFFTQAVAALLFAGRINKRLRLFINGSRSEQRGEQVLKNIVALFDGREDELVFLDWLPHDEFVNFIRGMDYGLQVSFTETFNIVAADFVESGTPIVVSSEIGWMPEEAAASPTSAEDIAQKLLDIHRTKRNQVVLRNKQALSNHNYAATRVWLDALSRY